MKKLLSISILLLLIVSCDDGDIIYTTLAFDDIALQRCGDVGDYVLFKIDNDDNETFSLRLSTRDSIFWEANTFEYPIGVSGHSVDYRKLNGSITADYFCSSVPPTSPGIRESYTGTGGTAKVITTPVFYENDTIPVTDSIIAHRTNIRLINLKMEGRGETIRRDSLNLGILLTPVTP